MAVRVMWGRQLVPAIRLTKMRVAVVAVATGLLCAVSAPVRAQDTAPPKGYAGPDLSVPEVAVGTVVAADPLPPAQAPTVTPPLVTLPIRQDDSPLIFRRAVTEGDWSFDCVSQQPDQLGQCSVKRDLVSQDGRNIVAVLLMQGPASDGEWRPDSGIDVIIQPPVGIAAGVTLTMADGSSLSGPLTYCTDTRCVARLIPPDGYFDALMAARGATLIWSNLEGIAVRAGFSTMGLAAVLGVPQP